MQRETLGQMLAKLRMIDKETDAKIRAKFMTRPEQPSLPRFNPIDEETTTKKQELPDWAKYTLDELGYLIRKRDRPNGMD